MQSRKIKSILANIFNPSPSLWSTCILSSGLSPIINRCIKVIHVIPFDLLGAVCS